MMWMRQQQPQVKTIMHGFGAYTYYKYVDWMNAKTSFAKEWAREGEREKWKVHIAAVIK